MPEIRRGMSRVVVLTKRRAYKIPALSSWRGFLWGLLSNLRERERSGEPGLCPVLWSAPGGLLVVMPRCSQAPLELLPDPHTAPSDDPDAWKADSYGLLAGEVVRLDYHGAVEPKEVA